ncbi:MAG: hypothetical protein GC164_00250 [Phycisphaera sp.]|nr:hypothetical protein [Phycisphaera sp.]
MRSRVSPFLSPIVSLLFLVGCDSLGMSRLDREVDRMIEGRQSQTLGSHASNDQQRVPTREPLKASRSIYDEHPATANPSAEDLPVRARTDETSPAGVRSPLTEESPAAGGQDILELDLEGVLCYAIEHSREYRSEKEALILSALDLLAEHHLWGPRFFSTFSAGFTGTPEAGDHDQVFELLNTTGVRQRLPYGGEASVSAVVNYINRLDEAVAGSSVRDEQGADVTASITLPLLRGAGEVAREDLIQSERELVYATRRFERFRREFLVSIATNYFDLLRQRSQIGNFERQVKNFEWLRKRIEALANAGRTPFFEVQRSEQQVLFAQNSLASANEGYAGSLDAFKVRLGIPTVQPLAVKPVDLVIPDPVLDAQQAVARAWEYRLDLQTSRDRVDDAKRQVRVAANNRLPDLDVSASVSVPATGSKRYAGLDLDAGSGGYTAGVTFDAPLDRRVEDIRYRQSLITFERAERQFTLDRDRVAQDVRDSARQIEQSRFTLDLQARNIELSSKRLRGVLLRLRSLGPRDFIEAQDDLLQAENLYDSAKRDLRVSILRFLLDTGQMRVAPDGRWLSPTHLKPEIKPATAPPQPAGVLEEGSLEESPPAPEP